MALSESPQGWIHFKTFALFSILFYFSGVCVLSPSPCPSLSPSPHPCSPPYPVYTFYFILYYGLWHTHSNICFCSLLLLLSLLQSEDNRDLSVCPQGLCALSGARQPPGDTGQCEGVWDEWWGKMSQRGKFIGWRWQQIALNELEECLPARLISDFPISSPPPTGSSNWTDWKLCAENEKDLLPHFCSKGGIYTLGLKAKDY